MALVSRLRWLTMMLVSCWMNGDKKAKNASSSVEESVYLLKFNYFPLSDDRIFSYIRSKN